MAQLDLGNIKTQVKSILDAANTTTAAPVDLSSGLNIRVKKVIKLHPQLHHYQPSFFPLVSMYFDTKTLSPQTMAVNQPTAKRKAELDLKLVGVIFDNTVPTDLEDESDNELQSLMENIEEIMRSSDTLNGSVLWSFPTACEYYTFNVQEETVMRVGILNLKLTQFY